MFSPKNLIQSKDSIKKVKNKKEKSYIIVPDYVKDILIEKKLDYCIFNTMQINITIVRAIKNYDPDVLPELKKLENFLIAFKKLRLFYNDDYQIVVKFDKYFRKVSLYKREVELYEEIVDIRNL